MIYDKIGNLFKQNEIKTLCSHVLQRLHRIQTCESKGLFGPFYPTHKWIFIEVVNKTVESTLK